ncbi:DUF1493 family protein [Acidovorax sp. SUPP2522]|uniref:DUF1493 family protein n=1 Tax=unclassified Acidovorax TaxID=2684926 RepID=UPI00234B32DD|nr:MULTISPECIES: DUF1493 family protein [unclassified Acidovorax]WCM97071.1 DUF1493 family protein [Acidovorax sp. GBBC 1281]GKT15683.1 DUF1493 family protein [Acidovorax sp. SUPP2522]
MKRHLIEEIEDFARNESGIFPSKTINQLTTIEDDLQITGDDAVDFMEKFFDKFEVDYEAFEFQRYFNGEGLNPLKMLLLPLPGFRAKLRKEVMKVPLTLEMLARAVELKRWDAAKIEGRNAE